MNVAERFSASQALDHAVFKTVRVDRAMTLDPVARAVSIQTGGKDGFNNQSKLRENRNLVFNKTGEMSRNSLQTIGFVKLDTNVKPRLLRGLWQNHRDDSKEANNADEDTWWNFKQGRQSIKVPMKQ